MSTLSDLKKMRVDLSKQILELSLSVTDEDRKGLLLQELNGRMEEIEAEIEKIEAEEKAAKEVKKQSGKDKKQ